jgi:hypothetical protein
MTDEHTEAAAPRRGRKAAATKVEGVQETDATPRVGRRKRGSTGGFALKLQAPQRPGYVRRFVNGDPARIQRMQDELGYTMVNDVAGEGNARTDGLGTRIARHAGKDENGKPFQTYLMETPIEEYQIGMEEREEGRKPFEEAIRRSTDTTGEVPDAYQPGQSTIRFSG